MSNDAKQRAGASASDSEDEEDVFHDARFPADEETRLLEESRSIKAEANKLFSAASYDEAITCYDRALASCPNYLDYEVAVLRSNMAACYLKLEDWKASVDSATACIDRLDKVLPPTPAAAADSQKGNNGAETAAEEAVVEITGDNEDAEEEQLKRLQQLDQTKRDVMRIRAKALMRRARARMQLGGWANLQGAEEDYKELAAMDNLPPDDRRVVQKGLRELPAKINQAREKDMAEMMGKLKDLGNGILKPFGLSTENFKFVQDPKTGGYSMNFQSG
ncbi:putative tetratricopeptide repeat protein 1 [Aspergillus homomorphus CBS 101889]|uniref:Putative tetratricopeptide repeat protein 1 n=1 Tax=Aspergillus homomorphus (strain CBS 101889) TaxID=1450537 RepID=A0A395IC64_ASPHC|nr:putative tetratricopeptide repeat protein 1 [Aspergillus homomorphus CBS 101889]RAL15754.1 putative tetratricopeptide repeat protein 1 [Aspergillus homomorphus CBS 101889]